MMQDGITLMEIARILSMEKATVQKIKAADKTFPQIIGRRTDQGLIYDRAAFRAWYSKRKVPGIDAFLAQAFITRKPVYVTTPEHCNDDKSVQKSREVGYGKG